MTLTQLKKIIPLVFVSIMLLGTKANAAIIIDSGPGWPDNADTTGVTGTFITPTSNSWLYPNISNSAVANLYFGLSSAAGTWGYSMNSDRAVTAAEAFSWSADTANSILYTGTTTISLQGVLTSFTTGLRLTALQGATVVTDSTVQALANSVHSFFKIDLTPGSVFEVKREVLVQTNSGWVDANTFFDNTFTYTGKYKDRCDQCSVSSYGTGFYSELVAVQTPEPSALVLLALGMLAMVKRSKQSS